MANRYANLWEIAKPGQHVHMCLLCGEAFVDERQARVLLKQSGKSEKEQRLLLR